MFSMRSSAVLLGVLLALSLSGDASRAEDFSVHLDELAETDTEKPMPEYALDRVLTRTVDHFSSDVPDKVFDVFIRFKEFGDVRLGEARESGPSNGKIATKGMTFRSGLAYLDDVKAGWIKDSPELFIVAWVDEPDGRGTGLIFSHMCVIVQLKDRRAQVLLRGRDDITARSTGGIQMGTMTSSHFSFNRKQSSLEECVTRCYDASSNQPHDLGHLRKDENGDDLFVASINETITLSYTIADGKLVRGSSRLVYKTQKQDELSEIARFYLGPSASRDALLKANPDLAATYKNVPPEAMIHLDAGLEVTVPVPDKWLTDNFLGHELFVKKEKD